MKKKKLKEKMAKEKFMYLPEPALIVYKHDPTTMNKPWTNMVLRKDAIVRVVKNIPSRVTGLPNEITVNAVDIVGREQTGWLAANTKLKPATKKKLANGFGELRIAAWDTLRSKITFHEGWDVMTWVATFGHLNIPLLHAVIRELGGVVPKTDDPDTANVRVLRLVLNNKELKMSAVKASRKSGKGKKTTSSKVARGHRAKSKKESRGGGRTSAFAGKVIRRTVKENPRREGSVGYKNWSIYKKGMTYEDFLKAGGVRGCLAKDIKRGHVKLVSA